VAPLASCDDLEAQIPAQENKPFDMLARARADHRRGQLLRDQGAVRAGALTGFARIDGRPVGIVANQPRKKGGVLFVDSADKAARFIWLCDAFGLPIVFLADVPGFMVGVQVERQGIIRAGAKMISAVSSATVPRFSVIVRKAYGAGSTR
jgi:acetyl-CoA carboxylase carboxyltransferase component